MVFEIPQTKKVNPNLKCLRNFANKTVNPSLKRLRNFAKQKVNPNLKLSIRVFVN